ncbi:MAG TPA: hypothetical protein VM142_10855 [Acidimicrobiales bacterium]|nr:hypothetical protein [Acidimicrobiales bacterium]
MRTRRHHITLDDVARVAERVLANERVVAVVGPVDDAGLRAPRVA